MTLVDYLLTTGSTSSPDTDTDSAAIIKYIEENFTFPGLSLDFLTGYFHISQSNLSMIIKNSLGIGFHEYLTTLRVDKAKSLLTSTKKNITKICQDCGFSSEQTFYRAFKKVTGLTPTEFRKSKDNNAM